MYAMTFGKHKGVPIAKVPTGYLRWLAANGQGIDPALEQALMDELDRREDGEQKAPCLFCAERDLENERLRRELAEAVHDLDNLLAHHGECTIHRRPRP